MVYEKHCTADNELLNFLSSSPDSLCYARHEENISGVQQVKSDCFAKGDLAIVSHSGKIKYSSCSCEMDSFMQLLSFYKDT